MQTFLTNAIIFTMIAFSILMATDFILGLIDLAYSTKSNTVSAKSTTVSAQPPRPEDVFKIIDDLEKTPPTKTEAKKLVPSTLARINVPSLQFAPQFSTVGSAVIDYEAMTIRELKGLASSLHIPYYSRKRKAELIKAIQQC